MSTYNVHICEECQIGLRRIYLSLMGKQTVCVCVCVCGCVVKLSGICEKQKLLWKELL